MVDGVEVRCPPCLGACCACRVAKAPSTSSQDAGRLTALLCAPPQVHGRPHAFDIKLEDGRTIFERAAAPSPASLPQYSDLFDRLRQAGLQAAAA